MKSHSPGHNDASLAIRIACRTLNLDPVTFDCEIYDAAKNFNGSWKHLEIYAAQIAQSFPKPRWTSDPSNPKRLLDTRCQFDLQVIDHEDGIEDFTKSLLKLLNKERENL